MTDQSFSGGDGDDGDARSIFRCFFFLFCCPCKFFLFIFYFLASCCVCLFSLNFVSFCRRRSFISFHLLLFPIVGRSLFCAHAPCFPFINASQRSLFIFHIAPNSTMHVLSPYAVLCVYYPICHLISFFSLFLYANAVLAFLNHTSRVLLAFIPVCLLIFRFNSYMILIWCYVPFYDAFFFYDSSIIFRFFFVSLHFNSHIHEFMY